ncbi:MAG: tyrosine--tRNA ligase [Porticoccaceae bacterium]|jgi:tyrosyl-tRNA synthetase|nr:tyrosine--tRNA ligase [Porticoccaceae bacterium]
MTDKLLDDLNARGLIAQRTAESDLDEHLQESRYVYCGFDPTADSLHIGSLVPLLMLRRFQLAGHRPIALVGGSTGLIGDPSFKAAERQLNGKEIVDAWCDRLRTQIEQFVDFEGENSALMVNNYDWTGDLSVLDFMRDVGKHFSVNSMIQKESVKQRIDREGSGISFTEFSYMLLQSWDFAELYRLHGCTLQVGGSDQWGNITGGIDLTRRIHGAQVFGLTMPLIAKADGTKFGKTESGTIWLDAGKTSPYSFYQFWLQAADADVYNFLRYFTFLSVEEIAEIERADQEKEGKPEAQSILAAEVTKLVHGEEALSAAQRITEALFSGDLGALTSGDCEQLELDGLPTSKLIDQESPLTNLFVEAGLAKNGSQAKDALKRNAVLVNGKAIGLDQNMDAQQIFTEEHSLQGNYFVVRLGKKSYHLFKL